MALYPERCHKLIDYFTKLEAIADDMQPSRGEALDVLLRNVLNRRVKVLMFVEQLEVLTERINGEGKASVVKLVRSYVKRFRVGGGGRR